jgi:maleylpyruvate isomerase
VTDEELHARLQEIAAAEGRFRATVETFDGSDLRAPSLCERWTRGHVIAHVALNAHSLVNLMEWARTGVETPQYPGWAERDADIERFSTRTPTEHLEALREAAAAFRAARALPLDRWGFEVRGIGSGPQPVVRFLFGRLREVEIHHVDLDARYRSGDWEDSFVRRVLDEVPARLGPRVTTPFTAEAADLGVHLTVGEGAPVGHAVAPGHVLLAWLLGRSRGSDVHTRGGLLPRVPSWG